jgi:hypothetical protein
MGALHIYLYLHLSYDGRFNNIYYILHVIILRFGLHHSFYFTDNNFEKINTLFLSSYNFLCFFIAFQFPSQFPISFFLRN